MKLQYQLNIAFTTLLLVILTVTGITIYSLILDLLIQDEQRQLEQKGEILVNMLTDQYNMPQNTQQLRSFLEEQDLQLFLYDRNQDKIILSTMPNDVVAGFSEQNHFSNDDKELWDLGNNKYVNSRILFSSPRGMELILLTPLNDLRLVQGNFIVSLSIVFLIGAIVAVILSYFLTRKLVTPLSRLKTQLKKIEKRQFDDIERIRATGEIKEVEQSVYEMAAELQRYMKSQQSFFQNASHELKTPLMTIQGYAEGIRDHVFDEADRDKGLEVMVTEVNRLKTIINEMILLAKLDSEQSVYRPENVQVLGVIEQLIDRTLPLVHEKNISLTHHGDQHIYLQVDEEKFLRALLNITINGIRHATSQVQIVATQEQGTIQIIVEDDGSGVPEEILPHIFHRFVKGNGGETGLGLAIARAIVEQSGGKLTVDRSQLGGARFIMTFNSTPPTIMK